MKKLYYIVVFSTIAFFWNFCICSNSFAEASIVGLFRFEFFSNLGLSGRIGENGVDGFQELSRLPKQCQKIQINQPFLFHQITIRLIHLPQQDQISKALLAAAFNRDQH